MILTCGKCSKRYFVRDEEIGPQGRKVRCIVCKYTWFQNPNESMIPIKVDPEEVPSDLKAVNESMPPRFSLGWILFISSIIALIGFGYFARHAIVQAWPTAAIIYDSIGLEVAVAGKGLKIENVQPQHTEDNGKNILVVRGEVVNASHNVSIIPPINIQLMSPCEDDSSKQCVAYEWQHTFSESRLLPGEHIAFETEPHEIPNGLKNLRVQF